MYSSKSNSGATRFSYVVNKKNSLTYGFVIFQIGSTFLTPEKITHSYQNRR